MSKSHTLQAQSNPAKHLSTSTVMLMLLLQLARAKCLNCCWIQLLDQGCPKMKPQCWAGIGTRPHAQEQDCSCFTAQPICFLLLTKASVALLFASVAPRRWHESEPAWGNEKKISVNKAPSMLCWNANIGFFSAKHSDTEGFGLQCLSGLKCRNGAGRKIHLLQENYFSSLLSLVKMRFCEVIPAPSWSTNGLCHGPSGMPHRGMVRHPKFTSATVEHSHSVPSHAMPCHVIES